MTPPQRQSRWQIYGTAPAGRSCRTRSGALSGGGIAGHAYRITVPPVADDEVGFPVGSQDERELLLWRWIDGGFRGVEVSRSEEEFRPHREVTIKSALGAYRRRAASTDAAVRSLDLTVQSDPDSWAESHDLRWVVLHLINETARHAGHADATRELLDGWTGE